MWTFRPGFAAWLLFALACLVPSWLLRGPVAAEVLPRRARTLGYDLWDAPGPYAQEYLVRVLRDSSDPLRRSAAVDCLFHCDDAIVCKALIESFTDPAIRAWGRSTILQYEWRKPGALAGALDQIGDDGLFRILILAPSKPRCSLFSIIWRLRPAMGERVVSRVLRETADERFSADLCGSWPDAWGILDEEVIAAGRVHRMRALEAGLSNPHEAIRRWCEQALAEIR